MWYQESGQESDVVLSTRVRFARNLRDYPFGEGLTGGIRKELLERIIGAAGDLEIFRMETLDEITRMSFAEQHLCSPEFAAGQGERLLLCSADRHLAVMAPEEDHLRIQAILPGLAIEEAYTAARSLENRFADALPFAFDKRLGYLTHCPTNLGTAMRASVMLFLPGLRRSGGIDRILPTLGRLGFTIRGMFGEGSKASASLYQLSNQQTLGINCRETLEKLSELVSQILLLERQARAAIRQADPIGCEDRALRAYGILRYAKKISSSEFMKYYEQLRSYSGSKENTELPQEPGFWDRLLIETMPATLMCGSSRIGETGRDLRRAAHIQKALTNRGG